MWCTSRACRLLLVVAPPGYAVQQSIRPTRPSECQHTRRPVDVGPPREAGPARGVDGAIATKCSNATAGSRVQSLLPSRSFTSRNVDEKGLVRRKLVQYSRRSAHAYGGLGHGEWNPRPAQLDDGGGGLTTNISECHERGPPPSVVIQYFIIKFSIQKTGLPRTCSLAEHATETTSSTICVHRYQLGHVSSSEAPEVSWPI